MKKNMIKVATFVVAMTTVAGFASCSNDENINDEFTATVSNNVTPSVISVNRIDGSVQIPVNFEGKWTAEVKENEDELAWAGVKQSEGQVPVPSFSANSTLSTGNSRIRFAFLLSSHFFRNFARNISNI